MNSRLRSVGAVVAGVVVAYVVITAMEILTSRIYPMPPGVSLRDNEALAAWIQQLPATAFLLVLVGWAGGAFLGGMLAARIAPNTRLRHALFVGALLLIAGIVNMLSIPHPVWMWVGAFVVFIPGAYAGARLVEKRSSPQLSTA